jgi:hypothetical protein
MNFPLLQIFLEMMFFFLWILWFFLLFRIITDLFRSKDIGGWGKAGWMILVIILPLLGVLIYLIARGGGMADRELARQQAAQDDFKEYVRKTAATAPSKSSVDELAQLAELRDKGVLTPEEFTAQKAKLLA